MKQFILIRFLLLGSLALFSGCIDLREARHPRQAQPVPQSILSSIAYTKPDLVQCTESNMFDLPHYIVRRIDMPAAANFAWSNRTVALDVYLPKSSTTKRYPVILILPIIGGEYPIEKHFANYFAKHGMAVVLVRRDKMIDPNVLTDINDMLRQAAVDAQQAIDWVETRPELDRARIGLFGVSLGAIRGAFLLPVDPRIRAATLGLVGGDLPWILAHSLEPGIKKRRPPLLEKLHLTLDEFQAHMRDVITCDPILVAPAVDPAKVLLILAACDTSVPFKKGWELREAMGKPETLITPTGHYTTLFYIPYIKAQCLRFFRERFAGPPD